MDRPASDPACRLLTGGLLVDGTGAPARRADLLIRGDRIRAVSSAGALFGLCAAADRRAVNAAGNNGDVPVAAHTRGQDAVSDSRAPEAAADDQTEVVDCTGLVVCPGFIDAHSHSDLEALEHRAEKTRQGVTAQVVGNCGFSVFPCLPPDELVPSFDLFAGRAAGEWPDAAAYLAAVEARGSYTHMATLAGHAALRVHVAGTRAGPLAPAACQAAQALLARFLEEGAVGLSTGLNEVPSSFADLEELVALCQVVRQYGGRYASHLRDYKQRVVEAVEEALAIGRRTGVPVQLSHLQTVGRRNWDKLDEILAGIDRAAAAGVDVGIDAYPYLAGSCHLTQLLPTWALEGGTGRLLERLHDADTRRRIAAHTEEGMGNDWQDILVASAPGQTAAEGRTVQDVADGRGVPGVEAALDLLRQCQGLVRIVSFNQSEENLRKVLSHPRTSVITDGLVTPGKPHPRTFGTYPKFLGEFVRDKRWLSLEEGVRKATGLPAERWGLIDRGTLMPGAFADVVVFDYGRIGTDASYQEPDRPPQGVVHVLVNGQWVLREGQLQPRYPGRALRLAAR